jgi:UDP-N-acetylmuramate dehydrogenase
MKGLIAALRGEGFSGELALRESLARHCSLGVGGDAALYAVPRQEHDLGLLLQTVMEAGIPWMPLGGGTNVLFSDRGYRGCVVRLGEGFRRWERLESGLVEVGAGLPTPALVEQAAGEGLAGLEFAAGIPGTVGGALRMNAGAGAGVGAGEMAQAVAELEISLKGRAVWRRGDELAFAYRNLVLPRDAIITAARLRVKDEDPRAVRRRVEESIERRRRVQPRDSSAGCWFRNPPGESAGRLIDAAGLKGARIGGAEVSAVHGNFLVRRGDATAEDFRALAEKVRDQVARRFGVLLAEEVHVVEG